MKKYANISILLITLVVIISSCSKARIEKPIDDIDNQNLIQFIPLDNYFESKKTLYLSFEMKGLYNPYTIKTNYTETRVGTNNYFIDPLTNNKPEYPFIFELTELITKKDLILYNIQPIDKNNNIINLVGVFNYVFKKEYRLLYLNNYIITSCTHNPEGYNYNTYDNYERIIINNNVTWVKGNTNYLTHLSWCLFGHKTDFPTNNYTNIKFTSDKYDLTNAGIYVVFSDINSFTRVQNLKSINLPVGEQAKLVAFGITNQGQLYSFYKNITIIENQTYNIDLSKTTDDILTILLDQL